ncbi:MAG TPA: hypothetical protein VGN68_06455 [Sphingopyxis sp.]|jgi:hypothetical protein|uniref:hypothetical protein n=1 Tax=Sphingopyxis sp. TaxID=1908224 RepID=UPI002E141AE7|nr:hypothetical protein [Sphingopyxis sp.]
METRVRVSVKGNELSVEGADVFVKEMYLDFMARMELALDPQASIAPDLEEKASAPANKKVPPSSKTKALKAPSGGKSKEPTYKPKQIHGLNLTGLSSYYEKFSPKNNSEKILIFGKFFEENLGQDKFKADEIYSCFRLLKLEIPKAFWQAFIDTRSKHQYINFSGHEEIWIADMGENFFNHKLAKAGHQEAHA